MPVNALSRRMLLVGGGSFAIAGVAALQRGNSDAASEHQHAMASPVASPVPATPEVASADVPREVVHIHQFEFVPAEIEIKTGTRIVWSNDDGAPHTATADDGSFDSSMLAYGQKYGFTFEVPGTYTYYCFYHANMTGKVTVTK